MRLFRATVLACYGILSLAATAPHSHELVAGSTAQTHDTAGSPALIDGTGAPDDPASGARPSLCGICAWGRSIARPAQAASLEEAGPTIRLPQRPADAIRPEAPCGSTILLRAPPAL